VALSLGQNPATVEVLVYQPEDSAFLQVAGIEARTAFRIFA